MELRRRKGPEKSPQTPRKPDEFERQVKSEAKELKERKRKIEQDTQEHKEQIAKIRKTERDDRAKKRSERRRENEKYLEEKLLERRDIRRGKDLNNKIREYIYIDTRYTFKDRYTNEVFQSDLPGYIGIRTRVEDLCCYITHINRKEGVIIIEEMDRTEDEKKKPGALHNSHVSWHLYHLAIEENIGKDPHELRFATDTPRLMRVEIVPITNPDMISLIDKYAGFDGLKQFERETKEYYIFSRKPHCVGTSFLLGQHQDTNAFNNLLITTIEAGWVEDSRGIPTAKIILHVGDEKEEIQQQKPT